MKGLKITISMIIILVLFIFLAVPFGIGLWTQYSYKKLIENLPSTEGISTKLIKYKLGWFHSTATIALDIRSQSLNSLSKKHSNTRIILYNDIKQGPVIFAKQSNGAIKTIFALSQTVTHAPGIRLKATTTWQFNNEINSLFSSQQFDLNLSGMALEIKGLRGATTYNASNKHWKGNINIDSGTLSSQPSFDAAPTTLAAFVDVAYSGNVRRIGLLGYGKQSLSFSTLKLMPSLDEQKNPTINNLTFTSNVEYNKNTTSFDLTFDANKITNAEFDINSFALKLGVENLNTSALNNLVKISHEQSKNPNNSAAFAKMAEASMKLFHQGFSVKLKQFLLGTSQGQVDAKGYVTLPKLDKKNSTTKVAALATGMLQIQVPKQWLLNQVTTSISLMNNKKENNTPSQTPMAQPIDQATTMVQQWENEGYLIPTGNDYVANISYKDGKLLVNGKPFNLKKKPNADTQTQPLPDTDQGAQ